MQTTFNSCRYFLKLAILIALGLLLGACIPGQRAFSGTELTANNEAPGFVLTDQFGEQVSLYSKRGSVVALTFIYTRCSDICPLTTISLKQAYNMLGEDTENVEFIAVSVDPDGDTPESTYNFLRNLGMLDVMSFLTGSHDDLSKIWNEYHIAVVTQPADSSESALEKLAGELVSVANEPQTSETSAQKYLRIHSAPVYLIDQHGKLRSIITDFTSNPERLVHDVKLVI